MLSPQQQDGYQADGYPVLPDFKPAHELAALRKRALQIVEAFDEQAHQDIFSTQDQARRSAGRNFLGSAEGIECFFEEEAFDADGRLRQAKALSINKIGHALHDLDPVFERFSCSNALAELALDLSRYKQRRAAAGGHRHAGVLAWPAAALQRAQPVGRLAPCLHPACHRRARPLRRAQLAAAQCSAAGARVLALRQSCPSLSLPQPWLT